MNVVMAVQHQLDAVALETIQQRRRIGQPLDPGVRSQRVMHQKDAKHLLARQARQQAIERFKLHGAQRSRRHEGWGRQRGGQADQRKRAASAQRGKDAPAIGAFVALKISRPGFGKAESRRVALTR